jgi:uncharacterized protein (UPF0261 family)
MGKGRARAPTVVVLATMDTKGAEAGFVEEFLRGQGVTPWVVDVGLREPVGLLDVPNGVVARAGGMDLDEIVRLPSRDQMIAAMGRGAAAVLGKRLRAGALHGVLALGGNQGAAIAAIAMRDLPFGLPKVIVTTMASGNVRPYVGCKDILTLFSVADLLGGPNRVTAPVLRNAALAVAGMALGAFGAGTPGLATRPAVAITALGNTHPAVTRAMQRLARAGYEPIAFHASGACGSAMEELVATGEIDAVLDLTPHELTEEVLGDGTYTPVRPGRMTAAGRRGIPQVVSTGGMEYLCFGPPETVPAKYRGRPCAMHNPMNPNIRVEAEELARVGRTMADRLNAAHGPAAVFVPLRGWSVYGGPGGPLHDPVADGALVRALAEHLEARVPVHRLDLHINDPAFADACVDALVSMLGSPPGVEGPEGGRAASSR